MSATVTVTRADMERAASAIKSRIHSITTDAIPEARDRRATGIVKMLEEAVTNDTAALERIQAALAAQPEAGA